MANDSTFLPKRDACIIFKALQISVVTRTQANTNPKDTEASAAGRSACTYGARKSKS